MGVWLRNNSRPLGENKSISVPSTSEIPSFRALVATILVMAMIVLRRSSGGDAI